MRFEVDHKTIDPYNTIDVYEIEASNLRIQITLS